MFDPVGFSDEATPGQKIVTDAMPSQTPLTRTCRRFEIREGQAHRWRVSNRAALSWRLRSPSEIHTSIPSWFKTITYWSTQAHSNNTHNIKLPAAKAFASSFHSCVSVMLLMPSTGPESDQCWSGLCESLPSASTRATSLVYRLLQAQLRTCHLLHYQLCYLLEWLSQLSGCWDPICRFLAWDSWSLLARLMKSNTPPWLVWQNWTVPERAVCS